MSEPLALALSWLAGCGLGAIFFGGLWWTVRKGVTADQPALWFLGSFLVRMGVALTGFYVISAGRLDRLLACVVGFAVARAVVSWLTRTRPAQDARHAP